MQVCCFALAPLVAIGNNVTEGSGFKRSRVWLEGAAGDGLLVLADEQHLFGGFADRAVLASENTVGPRGRKLRRGGIHRVHRIAVTVEAVRVVGVAVALLDIVFGASEDRV